MGAWSDLVSTWQLRLWHNQAVSFPTNTSQAQTHSRQDGAFTAPPNNHWSDSLVCLFWTMNVLMQYPAYKLFRVT